MSEQLSTSPAPAKRVNGLAVASLVLGILWLGWIGSILAVVFGHLALRRATNRGMALAGLVLGYIGVVTLVLTIVIATAGGKSDDPVKEGDKSTGQGATEASTVTTVGKPITNAGMTYLVTKASTTSSLAFDTKPEDGAKFVVIDLTLTNKKDETKTFNDSTAILHSGGTKFESTSKALGAFGDQSMIFKEVQPGLPTKGKIAFEVPTGKIKGAQLVIADIWGSGEITINLGL